jgi:hypothetical protein
MQWQGDSMYGGRSYKPFKQRGGCLLVWLIFVIGGAFIGTLQLMIGGPEQLLESMSELLSTEPPSWYVPFIIIANLATLACGIGIWMWKRWGFYGYIAIQGAWFLAMLPFASAFVIIVNIFSAAIAIGIAWFVVSPYWEDLE